MPDAPSSPRKTVSSVSANARSPSQKKAGAPKPKGAVRAKSGCYTCRIRRKKCDEQPNAEGACQTCVRLRLQCLGFGAKRPDWMRENNSVTELREKIKQFLASQGMIKGHSGSGPRSTDGDPQMLILVENMRSSPSSPPTPTLSASSSDSRPQITSFVRDGSHYPAMPQHAPPQQSHEPSYSSWQPAIPDLGHHDPPSMSRSTPMLPAVNDMLYSAPPQPMLPSTSLVPISSSSTPWQVTGGPNPTAVYPSPISPPSSSSFYAGGPSTFSSTYSMNVSYTEEDNSSPVGPSIPSQVRYEVATVPDEQSELVQHYFRSVLPIQYLLADASIGQFMYTLLASSASARDAACVLSAIHLQRARYPTRPHNNDYGMIYRRIQNTLASKQQYNEGDAMAGLNIVSTFLFSGGRGPWDSYLNIASNYVTAVLNNTRYYGPDDVLKRCSESTRFIIKTTMWFDVLASVTTLQVPRFLETYRHLFGRPTAYIDDATSTAPEISMLPVMGCENQIVLAIAEISNLAHWKEMQRRRGCLSVPQLVERGMEIEAKYLPPAGGQGSAYGGVRFDPTTSDPEVAQRRRLTNDIFRASARVYLHTVLSGDYPSCPEIITGVAETIECLRRVPMENASATRSVLRSVVFSICICGCLTDDLRHRAFLLQLLQSQQAQGDNVGNVTEVRALMEQVWSRRESSPANPVNWREVMRESQRDLLLLV